VPLPQLGTSGVGLLRFLRFSVLGNNEPRLVDLAPAEVFATLLDEGRYIGSVRTMHRVLRENAEVRERRNQLRHPAYSKPELLATAPNQLWSWDIVRHEAL
jgi:putative transposase